MNNYYMVQLQKIKNSDDVFLPIPKEILNKLNWKENDTIELFVNEEGNLQLQKLPNF